VIPENKIICGDCLAVLKDWPLRHFFKWYLGCKMALATQGNKIVQIVCHPIIVIKKTIWPDMMNVKFLPNISLGFTANLASIAVSLSRFISLAMPICASIRICPTSPNVAIFTRNRSDETFLATNRLVTSLNSRYPSSDFCATHYTTNSFSYLATFTQTLQRTILFVLSISIRFTIKDFSANNTMTFTLNYATRALHRAKTTIMLYLRRRQVKLFFASRTSEHLAFFCPRICTFARTVLFLRFFCQQLATSFAIHSKNLPQRLHKVKAING